MGTMKHLVLGLALSLAGCGGAADAENAPDAAAAATPTATSSEGTAAPAAKYTAQSGIIESRTEMMGTTTTTVYFADHGRREATYSTSVVEMMGQRIETKSAEIRDGDILYRYDSDDDSWERWNMKDFAGAAPPASSGGGMDAAAMQTMMAAGNSITELPARTILGREAKGMEMEVAGMKMRMWMWDNIPLRSEVQMGEEPTVTEVVSLQLDVPVPEEKFKPPVGAKVVDGVLPGR